MAVNNKIYRYKFSDIVNEYISNFSKMHVYDNNEILIEQYESFWKENIDEMNREMERLKQLGFTNDLKNAIFRSIKYYHIKKLKKQSEESKQEKKESKRDYIKINKFIIQWIDTFIINNMKNKDFKPSKYYDIIIMNEEFQNMIKEEKPKLVNKYIKFLEENNEVKTDEDIENWWNLKIKKTYKNRYFNINNKNT
jgi:hypothetical protein